MSMSSGYRSWEEREAEAAKTRTEAKTAAKAAAAEVRRLDEDAKLDRHLKFKEAQAKQRREAEAAREADKRRRKRERKAAWQARADWVATNTDLAAALAVMVAGMIPAFSFQYESLAAAKVFGGLAALLAFMLEAGAWAATTGEVKALKARRNAVPYRVAVWCFTTAAAAINFAHGWEEKWWLGVVLAASSIVPVALFHMVMAGRHAAKPKPNPEEKARAQHEKQRRKDHKEECKLADRLVTAAPFGTLTFEDAFAAAWSIKHGTAKPGMTPDLHAIATRSQARLAEALESPEDDKKSIRTAILERLTNPLPGATPVLPEQGATSPVRKGSKGRTTPLSAVGSSQRVTQIPPSSESAPKGAVKGSEKADRKKPTPPRRKAGDTPRYHLAARVAAADTARKVLTINAVNGTH